MTATGRFLSFEGVEAVGKSTTMQIAGSLLDEAGIRWVSTREPGGTPVAEALRQLLLGVHDETLTDISELLMMFAARAQNVHEVIRPALARGDWVLCDRFTDATLAYQGYGRGFSRSRILELAEWVHGDLWPDTTFLLAASDEVINARLAERGSELDRIEQQPAGFFERVADGYARLARKEPERFVLLDTSVSEAAVALKLRRWLGQFLEDK